jgi:hypothetical protein
MSMWPFKTYKHRIKSSDCKSPLEAVCNHCEPGAARPAVGQYISIVLGRERLEILHFELVATVHLSVQVPSIKWFQCHGSSNDVTIVLG